MRKRITVSVTICIFVALFVYCSHYMSNAVFESSQKSFDVGVEYLNQGDYDLALEKFNDALAVMPESKAIADNIKIAKRLQMLNAQLNENMTNNDRRRHQLCEYHVANGDFSKAMEYAMGVTNEITRNALVRFVQRAEPTQLP